jgi:hypothetical protein
MKKLIIFLLFISVIIYSCGLNEIDRKQVKTLDSLEVHIPIEDYRFIKKIDLSVNAFKFIGDTDYVLTLNATVFVQEYFNMNSISFSNEQSLRTIRDFLFDNFEEIEEYENLAIIYKKQTGKIISKSTAYKYILSLDEWKTMIEIENPNPDNYKIENKIIPENSKIMTVN